LEPNEAEQEVRFREPAGKTIEPSACWPGVTVRPFAAGLWVVDTKADSPLQTGDVILKVRGAETKGWSPSDFVAKLIELGQDAALRVQSGPDEREIMLKYEPECMSESP
jgi:hypothetical protein